MVVVLGVLSNIENMEILKAFKYRMYPNKTQKVFLEKQFGSARFVFNYFLRRCIDCYVQNKKGLNYNDTTKELALLKKQPEYIQQRQVSKKNKGSAKQ